MYVSFVCHPTTIFDCYVNQPREEEEDNGDNDDVDDDENFKRWFTIQAWHTLVHVCRKWRTVVLGSPRRLDLRLLYFSAHARKQHA
jgi:hypothetical protein